MPEARSETGFEIISARKLSPAVGREFELHQFEEYLEQMQDGLTVVLSGDSGVGKTRLLRIMQSRAEVSGPRWIVGRCSPRYKNFAFHPVVTVAEHLLDGSDEPEWGLALRDRAPEAVEVMAALFQTNRGHDRPPPPLPPRELRATILRALVEIVGEAASIAPVVLVIEDLHWADPSTLEFLTLLVAQGPVPQLLICVTTSSNLAHSWSTVDYVRQLTLDPLGDEYGEQMVRAIAGNVFPPEVVTDIARCADGVPLFIEELTEMVAETELLRVTDGGKRFSPHLWPTLPATLRETLVSRFSRLGSARAVAQVGATIGQEFDVATLCRASRFDDGLLREDLEKLTSAGLLVRDSETATATYRFKHVLVQDAAYGMMLKSTRRQLHRRVADALREQPTDGRVAHAHVLAFHYTEAGMYQHAIEYWIEAGKGCLAWACGAEAQAHLRRARALLQLLPQKDRRPFESDVHSLLQQIGDLWSE